MIKEANGYKEWFSEDGKRHRIDGPAIESFNSTEYWVNGVLHRDGGPSIVYHVGNPDGTGVGQKLFHLNGVNVPEFIAMAKSSDFKREWYFEEKNVEIKREIIRKFGIERIIKIVDVKDELDLSIGEAILLDKEDDYELIRTRLTENIFGTFLKMKNPSIGTFHMEGVPHNIKTVEEAISWRNHGLNGKPEILS